MANSRSSRLRWSSIIRAPPFQRIPVALDRVAGDVVGVVGDPIPTASDKTDTALKHLIPGTNPSLSVSSVLSIVVIPTTILRQGDNMASRLDAMGKILEKVEKCLIP